MIEKHGILKRYLPTILLLIAIEVFMVAYLSENWSQKNVPQISLFDGILLIIVGLGDGYTLVLGLIYLFSAPVYVTMETSLASMIPLVIVSGEIKVVQGYVILGARFLLASGTVVGAQAGTAIIKRFKPNILKLIFEGYFLYVALKFITGYFGIMIW